MSTRLLQMKQVGSQAKDAFQEILEMLNQRKTPLLDDTTEEELAEIRELVSIGLEKLKNPPKDHGAEK